MILKREKKRGFSIIEALVFLFIFTISVLTIYETIRAGIGFIVESKKKIAAVGLANEEVERMRNLGYDNLPSGATENIPLSRNGMTFYVTTNITEIDDADDGLTPVDSVSWDYKKINVEVKWSLANQSKKASANAIIVPPVREEDANYGYMRLHIVDQNGAGLAGASVNVTDLGDNELVYSGTVNAGGDIFLTGLDPGYHRISVTSALGNYPVETMAETAIFDPIDDHAEIMAKTLSEKTIQTDKVSSVNIGIKDTFGNTIDNLGYDIMGGKLLGIENGVDSIYDFSDSVGDSDGSESYSNMSFGPYFFNFSDLMDESTSTSYTFLWMEPIGDFENETFVDADEVHETDAVLAADNVPSLLVRVTDNVAGDPLEGVDVHVVLQSDPSLFDVTLKTNQFGKVYFPITSGQMTDEKYLITVSGGSFETYYGDVTLSGLTTEDITMHEL